VPDGPGLGVAVDEEFLAGVTVRRERITAPS
jgi:L-alanine-DL-glutamate epimerase-like enolase superfamily enzyme